MNKKIQPKIFIDTETSLSTGYTISTGYGIGHLIHFNDTGNEYLHKFDGVWRNIEQDLSDVGDGANVLFVQAKGTKAENGIELSAAIDKAATMSPSATNIITIVATPGYYTSLVLDTPYVNFTSLTGNKDCIIDNCSVNANNIYVKGITTTNAFSIASGLDKNIFENIEGVDDLFAVADSGTFIDCIGGNNSFGSSNFSGTVINCKAGTSSFGSSGFGGTAINCTGGVGCFGTEAGATCSGYLKDCVAGDYSYSSYQGIADGTFINCTGGMNCFGSEGNASGTFINCTGSHNSFGGHYDGSGSFSGVAKDCVGGDYSFGGGYSYYSGNFEGTATNCIGGSYSFGGGALDGGACSGILNGCLGGDYSFGGSSDSSGSFGGTATNCTGGIYAFGGGTWVVGSFYGIATNCVGEDYSFGGCIYATGAFGGVAINCRGKYCSFGSSSDSDGYFGGTAINCQGGEVSFGSSANGSGNIELTARLYYCKSDSAFVAPNVGGRLILCIDGSNNVVTI